MARDKRDTMRFRIIELLEQDSQCRNDDNWLIWKYIHDVLGIKIFIPFDEFKSMPSWDSIIRIRAHVQNVEKKFLPTDREIRKKRKQSEQDWHDWTLRARAIYGVNWK